MRSAIRMMDYQVREIDGERRIIAQHAGLRDDMQIDPNTSMGKEIIGRMRSGARIMSGDTSATNLARFNPKQNVSDSGYTWQDHASSAQKFMQRISGTSQMPSDGYNIAWHNGIGFDYNLARGLGIKVKNGSGIDTYDMMRNIAPLGSKHKTTGKSLMSYNLDEVANWLGLSRQSGVAHTGESDVMLGNQVLQKIMQDYGAEIAAGEEAYMKGLQDVGSDITGKIFQASGSYIRQTANGYRKNAAGSIIAQNLTTSKGSENQAKFDWEDRFIKEGGLYSIGGRFQNGNDWYTEIKDILTGETYMEMQTEQQFQRMMNNVNASGKFFNSETELPTTAARDVISKAMSTPFAYSTLSKMFADESTSSTVLRN